MISPVEFEVELRADRVDSVREWIAKQLRAVGWVTTNGWHWSKSEQRWSIEVCVVASSPHHTLQQETGLHHPVMLDHAKVMRGIEAIKKNRGSQRTYLVVLAYDPSSDFFFRNGI